MIYLLFVQLARNAKGLLQNASPYKQTEKDMVSGGT